MRGAEALSQFQPESVDSSWVALREPAQACSLPKSQNGKPLIDCIAQRAHAHTPTLCPLTLPERTYSRDSAGAETNGPAQPRVRPALGRDRFRTPTHTPRDRC